MFEGEYAKKEREKVNVPVYDELTIRQNLLISLYPDNLSRPQSVKNELSMIQKMKYHLHLGCKRDCDLSDQGVYLSGDSIEDYERRKRTYERLREENRAYVTEEQEKTFVMPKVSKDEMRNKLSTITNDIAASSGLSDSISSKLDAIERKLLLCTYDYMEEFWQSYEIAERSYYDQKSSAASYSPSRTKAYLAAKKRYEELSAFGKLKAKLQGKDWDKISTMHLSEKELNKLYGGNIIRIDDGKKR